MIAQLQPTECRDERPQASPLGPRGIARPGHKVNKKKRRVARPNAGVAGWVSKLGVFVGLIVGVVSMILGIRQIIPANPVPNVLVDGQASLIRSSKSRQVELLFNLTLLNEGGNVAKIPRPTVSLYVDSPDQMLDIPAEYLHFKTADGNSDVIFPVSLHEGASTFEKKIVCSIGGGPDGNWYPPGFLYLSLVFGKGHGAVNRCFVVTSPVPESIQDLKPESSRPIPINDCEEDFGGGFHQTNQLGGLK